MSFRDNLQHLRATRNMTQEQLAMLVGVSRQSVTKWEAEKAYPEMDKLIKICQIFDCTLDELVQGNLTTRSADEALSMPSGSLAADVVGYDEHTRAFAKRMAAGIVLCVLGVAVSTTMDYWMGDGPAALGFFACVGLGLVLIIPAALEDSAFKKAHPYVTDFHTDDEHISGKRAFGTYLAAGICCILVGFGFGTFADWVGIMDPVMGLFFVAVAVGIALIAYAGITNSRMDVESYNISALEELSEDEIASIVGEGRAQQVLEKVRANKRLSMVCGVIMLLATAIALPLMFWATWFGEPFWRQYFWMPWVVGGIFCGVASIVKERRSRR